MCRTVFSIFHSIFFGLPAPLLPSSSQLNNNSMKEKWYSKDGSQTQSTFNPNLHVSLFSRSSLLRVPLRSAPRIVVIKQRQQSKPPTHKVQISECKKNIYV